MSDPLPENLALLYTAFGQDVIDSMLPGDRFEIDGVEFVCSYSPGSTATSFNIVKSVALVDRYRELVNRFRDASIVELGIAEGGGTALLALLAHPRHLVAVDLEPTPVEALTEFVEAHGLSDVVSLHYSVDQSDRARLGAIVETALDGDPLDLVIDDCSHQFAPTRSSFETLFPRLRPGGLYVIEDWNNDHIWYDAIYRALTDPSAADLEARQEQLREGLTNPELVEHHGKRDPLTRLALELMVARCSRTDAIDTVSVDEYWIVVRRGSAELDPEAFRLDEQYKDHFGFVPPPRSAGA